MNYDQTLFKVFYLGDVFKDCTVSELNEIIDQSYVDGQCENWAVYQDCLAIFLD